MKLTEAFLSEAIEKWIVISATKNGAEAWGPFSTEQSAKDWLEWRKKQGDNTAESLAYDDDNGDVYIAMLENIPASQMTGGKKTP